MKLRIIHIISGLGDGGAEGTLYKLIINDKSENIHEVVSFMNGGKYSQLLKSQNIKVTELGQLPGRVSLLFLIKLFKYLSNSRPDIVQTWMYHADLVGGIISKILRIEKIIWNIRTSFLTGDNIKLSTKVVVKTCAVISKRIPNKIITCSNNAALFHKSIGFENNFTIIDNGYDLENFYPSQSISKLFRKQLSIADECFFIGMIARFDAQKDHSNLITALSLLKQKKINFKCIFVGRGMDEKNLLIKDLIDTANLKNNIILYGQSNDIHAVMNAIDLHVLSSSYGEAFPNVVAESMLCGTPCVVTDVGDSARIVGENGWVIEPNNSKKLYYSIKAAIDLKDSSEDDWKKLCDSVYDKSINKFGVEKMVSEYHKAWLS